MFLISIAFAGGMQTVAAAEQSLTEIGMVFGGVVLISYVFSYAVTQVAKLWRDDHKRKRLSLSSSFIRSTLLAFSSFLGLWYASHSLGLIAQHSWLVATLLAMITAPIAPLAWNPLIALTARVSDGVKSAIEKDRVR